MSKNNKRRTRRNKRNRNYGKRRRIKTFKTYSFTIRSAIVNYVTPDYTQKNLKFDVYNILWNTQTFQQLLPQFQQVKLDRVTFIGMPRVVQGTDPAPVWIYLDTFGMDNFNYVAIQELQGSRRLPVKQTSRTTFTQSGRQDDFHYWYDTEEQHGGNMSIRLHSEATPSEQKFWQFQIEYAVLFRGFTVEYQEGRNEDERTIRAISGSSGDENKTVNLEPEDPGEELNDINKV